MGCSPLTWRGWPDVFIAPAGWSPPAETYHVIASCAVASDRLAWTDAGADLLKALFHAILNNLDGLRGRLPRGRRALLGSSDRDLKHLPCEFGLQCDVFVNLAERLLLARKRRRLAQSRFQHLALLLRHRLRALRGYLRALTESINVLLLRLQQFVHIQLRQTEIAAELPQHLDV